jgi:hypothetical protein
VPERTRAKLARKQLPFASQTELLHTNQRALVPLFKIFVRFVCFVRFVVQKISF